MKKKITTRRGWKTSSDYSYIDWQKRLDEILDQAFGRERTEKDSRIFTEPSKSVEQQLEEALDKAGLGISSARDSGAEVKNGNYANESSETPPSIPSRTEPVSDSLHNPPPNKSHSAPPLSEGPLTHMTPLQLHDAEQPSVEPLPEGHNRYRLPAAPLGEPMDVQFRQNPLQQAIGTPHPYAPVVGHLTSRADPHPLSNAGYPVYGQWIGPSPAPLWRNQPPTQTSPLNPFTTQVISPPTVGLFRDPRIQGSSILGAGYTPHITQQSGIIGPQFDPAVARGLPSTIVPAAPPQAGPGSVFTRALSGLEPVANAALNAVFPSAYAGEPQGQSSGDPAENDVRVTLDAVFPAGTSIPFERTPEPGRVRSLPQPWYRQPDNDPARLLLGTPLQSGEYLETGLADPNGVPIYYRIKKWKNVDQQPTNLLSIDLSPVDIFLEDEPARGRGQDGFVAAGFSWDLFGSSKEKRERLELLKTPWLILGDPQPGQSFAELVRNGIEYNENSGYGFAEFGLETPDYVLEALTKRFNELDLPEGKGSLGDERSAFLYARRIAGRIRQQMTFGANGVPERAAEIFVEKWSKIDPRATTARDENGNIILLPAGEDGIAFYLNRPGWSPHDELNLIHDIVYYGGLAVLVGATGVATGGTGWTALGASLLAGGATDFVASRLRTLAGDHMGADTSVPITRDLIAAGMGMGVEAGVGVGLWATSRVVLPALRAGYDRVGGEIKPWLRDMFARSGIDPLAAARVVHFNDLAQEAGLDPHTALDFATELSSRGLDPVSIRPDAFHDVRSLMKVERTSANDAFMRIFGPRDHPNTDVILHRSRHPSLDRSASAQARISDPMLQAVYDAQPTPFQREMDRRLRNQDIADLVKQRPDIRWVANEHFIVLKNAGVSAGLGEETAIEVARQLRRAGHTSEAPMPNWSYIKNELASGDTVFGALDLNPTRGDQLSDHAWAYFKSINVNPDQLSDYVLTTYDRILTGGMREDHAFEMAKLLQHKGADPALVKAADFNDTFKWISLGAKVEEVMPLRYTRTEWPTVTHQPSAGPPLAATKGKTTTVLGSYISDMRPVTKEIGLPTNVDFGAKPGGFNILQVPERISGHMDNETFFATFNKPWLDAAIDRGDVIRLVSDPENKELLINKKTGKPRVFGLEIKYLEKKGFKYNSNTGNMEQ